MKDNEKINENNFPEKPSIPLIFLYSTVGIMVTVAIINFVAGAEYRDEKR